MQEGFEGFPENNGGGNRQTFDTIFKVQVVIRP
jgi:hypothetical protein